MIDPPPGMVEDGGLFDGFSSLVLASIVRNG
jgi:hypothetical protein